MHGFHHIPRNVLDQGQACYWVSTFIHIPSLLGWRAGHQGGFQNAEESYLAIHKEIHQEHGQGVTTCCAKRKLHTYCWHPGSRNLYLEGLGRHSKCISRAHFLPVSPCRPHAASTGILHTGKSKEATQLRRQEAPRSVRVRGNGREHSLLTPAHH